MKDRSLKILVAMMFAIITFAAACAEPKGGAANAEIAKVPIAVTSPTAAVPDGPRLYKENCSTCHGLNGEGDKKGIPLTSGHALNHTEAQYNAQIRFGKGNKMPAFKDKLTAEETAAIVNYVRNVIQAGLPRGTKH